MQRPVMNPMDVFEPATGSRRLIPWRRMLRWGWLAVRWVWRILLSDPMDFRRRGLRIEDGTPWQRFVRGLFYRLAFIPVLIVMTVSALVYAGTHPLGLAAEKDPLVDGVYFEPISFAAEGGKTLDAWLVPVVDAKRVIIEGEAALHKKFPAVVLLHDHRATRSQILPLIKPLHDDGWVVLAIGLRGLGTDRANGRTFGLNESQDVESALNLLRRRPSVDLNRLAVVGIGTGANAAMLAAEHDPAILAVVLDGPLNCADDAIARFVAPPNKYLQWMNPLCKWAFDIGYEKDLEEIDVARHRRMLEAARILLLPGEAVDGEIALASRDKINSFLRKSLARPVPLAADLSNERDVGDPVPRQGE
jgi:hypothetical protein